MCWTVKTSTLQHKSQRRHVLPSQQPSQTSQHGRTSRKTLQTIHRETTVTRCRSASSSKLLKVLSIVNSDVKERIGEDFYGSQIRRRSGTQKPRDVVGGFLNGWIICYDRITVFIEQQLQQLWPGGSSSSNGCSCNGSQQTQLFGSKRVSVRRQLINCLQILKNRLMYYSSVCLSDCRSVCMYVCVSPFLSLSLCLYLSSCLCLDSSILFLRDLVDDVSYVRWC